MKEIGKLIELLNEREIGEEGGELYYLSNGIIRDDGGNILYDYRIISKQFGFIKWLVERDKLDLEKLKDNMVFTMFTHCVGIGCEQHTAKEGDSILKTIGTDALIAYTAIQDNPISFLLSILR